MATGRAGGGIGRRARLRIRDGAQLTIRTLGTGATNRDHDTPKETVIRSTRSQQGRPLEKACFGWPDPG